MHHLGVQSNKGSEKTKLGFGGHKHPVCPKPRRLGSVVPEFLKPLKCNKHSQMNPEERSGILNMIAEKTTTEGRESVSCGCPATCYTGSPPGRTENPLVHDIHFIHQMEPFSPLPPTKLSDKFGFTSA